MESMRKKRKIREAEENSYQFFSNLPFDVTSLIMTHLSKKDNIIASTVCKTWNEACVSVRVEDPKPWLLLIYPPCREETYYKIYDPSLAKTYTHISSDFRHSSILHSTDGWLLMRDFRRPRIFFFNPFTRDIIDMPYSDYIGERIHAIAFSCAPTSNSCVIFAIGNISHQSHLTIKTCHLSTQVCASFTLLTKLPSDYGGFEQIVFSNGVFYCLTTNDQGSLGMFDMSNTTWNVLPRPRKDLRFSQGFLTEYQGDIFLIYVYKNNLRPTIYLELDLIKQEWREKKKKEISLGGFRFYLSSRFSLMGVSTPGMQQEDNLHNYNVWIRPSKGYCS